MIEGVFERNRSDEVDTALVEKKAGFGAQHTLPHDIDRGFVFISHVKAECSDKYIS